MLGSSYLYHDDWIEREENGKLVDVLFRWLSGAPEVEMDAFDAEDPDVAEYHQLPDTEALAERVRKLDAQGREMELVRKRAEDDDRIVGHAIEAKQVCLPIQPPWRADCE